MKIKEEQESLRGNDDLQIQVLVFDSRVLKLLMETAETEGLAISNTELRKLYN